MEHRHSRFANWAIWVLFSLAVAVSILFVEYFFFVGRVIEWSDNDNQRDLSTIVVLAFSAFGFILAWQKGGSITDDMGGSFNFFFNEKEYWEKLLKAQQIQVILAVTSVIVVWIINFIYSF